jgi:hypothetical protein
MGSYHDATAAVDDDDDDDVLCNIYPLIVLKYLNLTAHSVCKSCPATRYAGTSGGKYSSYTFLTTALDGGQWSASRPGRALPLGKDPRYPLDRRLGGPQIWSELVLTQRLD